MFRQYLVGEIHFIISVVGYHVTTECIVVNIFAVAIFVEGVGINFIRCL
jgi:hypothetical protein